MQLHRMQEIQQKAEEQMIKRQIETQQKAIENRVKAIETQQKALETAQRLEAQQKVLESSQPTPTPESIAPVVVDNTQSTLNPHVTENQYAIPVSVTEAETAVLIKG